MPMFLIHVINREFSASEEIEAADLEAARSHAMRGALEIGTDEVCKGSSFVGTEVIIECDGELQDRMVIAIGASRLR